MKRVSWIVLLAFVFALALTACGGDEPEATVEAPVAQEEPATVVEEAPAAAEETAVEEPAAEEQVAEESASEPEMIEETEVALADLKLSSLDELTSYRYDMVMDITAADDAGQEVTQSIQMILAVSTDPPATSMSMIAEGQEEFAEMGNIEFVQIDDTSYIVMGEMGCMALPADAEGTMSTDELTEGFTPESLMEDLENVTLVGEETIDGIDTLHYTYDEMSMMEEEMVGIESMEGHMYLAKDGGYMVRTTVDVVGDSKYMDGMAADGIQSGTTHIEMNLKDVNGNVEILVPASCEGQDGAADSEWPMLGDASEVMSMAGMATYTTETSAAEAIDFYNTAMTDMAYTFDEAGSIVVDSTGLLVFTGPNGESVTITISEDTDTGLTSVTILSATE